MITYSVCLVASGVVMGVGGAILWMRLTGRLG